MRSQSYSWERNKTPLKYIGSRPESLTWQIKVLSSLDGFLCSSSQEAEGKLDESSLVSASAELSAEDQELLKVYHHSFDDEKVDLDLIMHLLFNICQSSDEG